MNCKTIKAIMRIFYSSMFLISTRNVGLPFLFTTGYFFHNFAYEPFRKPDNLPTLSFILKSNDK